MLFQFKNIAEQACNSGNNLFLVFFTVCVPFLYLFYHIYGSFYWLQVIWFYPQENQHSVVVPIFLPIWSLISLKTQDSSDTVQKNRNE